jgi:hypothetical protein
LIEMAMKFLLQGGWYANLWFWMHKMWWY